MGDFYDATRDVFCPRNLFSDELPESSVRITPKKTIRCHYEIEGSTNEKCTNLGIGNELKVSRKFELIRKVALFFEAGMHALQLDLEFVKIKTSTSVSISKIFKSKLRAALL